MVADFLKQQGNAGIILSIAIILLAGFLCTRVTKRLRFPNVSGYIISGILIGPCVLQMIPEEVVAGMDFMTDIALAFIAFGVGKYFKRDILKKQGSKILTITIFEALTAGACITIAMVTLFRLPWSFSLLLGAIGCATAPASTIMTIRQYHAKGNFVDTILQVTALDDAVALIAFSICTALVEFMHEIRHCNGHSFCFLSCGICLLSFWRSYWHGYYTVSSVKNAPVITALYW